MWWGDGGGPPPGCAIHCMLPGAVRGEGRGRVLPLAERGVTDEIIAVGIAEGMVEDVGTAVTCWITGGGPPTGGVRMPLAMPWRASSAIPVAKSLRDTPVEAPRL
mmetsp:Transcript_71427/g.209729  ORF Transcript_71427/g.209729 Transcript_71427/m.209729 type:complete len:105 (-) Transcript_71427:995-1309(-)